ncbi:MAG TPA: hypothetical protein VMK65_13265, partial [Longimicrobiales bacterium]|nr:hypothetical protein [Longimicrobiales bacterium]
MPTVPIDAARGLRRTPVLAALVVLAGCAGASAPAPPPASPPNVDADVAIVGVSVIPMDRDTVLEGRTVLVRDGRIVSIAP